MEKLPKYTLKFDERNDEWQLRQDKTSQILKTFATKGEATSGGALKKVLGRDGGSVKIQSATGSFQEERTYPRSADPRKSKG